MQENARPKLTETALGVFKTSIHRQQASTDEVRDAEPQNTWVVWRVVYWRRLQLDSYLNQIAMFTSVISAAYRLAPEANACR